ncbi:MAG: hypothetical protein WBI14_06225 [Anaerolineaceae bacterium]
MQSKNPQPSKDKTKLLTILKWLWLVLVIVGAGYYFFEHRVEVIDLINHISIFRIIASLLLLLIGKLLIVLLVQLSLQAEGWSQAYVKTIGLYGVTSLGKYIPGGVWHFVGRFGAYRMHGFNTKQITRSFILENYWLLSSAAVVGLVAVCMSRFDLVSQLLNIQITTQSALLICALVIGLWVISLLLINRHFQKYVAGKIASVWFIIPVSLLLWILIGLSFFSMFPALKLSQSIPYIGGYALSWSVGYVAVFAPGGIGVREAVLALVFASIAPVETIAVYAAMNRVIWLVAELIFGMVGIIQKQEIMPKFPQKSEIEPDNQQDVDPPELPELEDPSGPEL